jgi:hypothetical protein
VEARHPDRFLIELYDLSPEVVVHSLHAQAETISRSLQELLGTLRRVAPRFVDLVTGDLEI